jgi:hypothetical protein
MDCFSSIDDPRRPSNKTLHDFREILVMAIAAVLSDCDTVEDFACWARTSPHRELLILQTGRVPYDRAL